MSGTNGKRRLRVAHVTPGLDIGGLEKLLVEFARHADRTRFDLHFVCLSERGPLAKVIESCGWPVTALEERGGLRPSLMLRLARLLRRLRCTVVHTHDDRPLVYGAPAARLAGVPRLLHTHHHGHLEHVSARQSALVSLAGRLANRIFCVSDDSARHLLEHGVPAAKVSILRNGIDLTRFPYRGPRVGGPAVTVARLSREKDVDTLLRAAALAVRETPSFQLHIAGAGPCRPELEKTAAALALDRHVTFLGTVSDVPALLAQASLFVLPSLTEGISLTLLEAMASGLPVVTTRVGGNPEVVSDGETGVLVPARDPAALARGMLRFLRDPEEGRRMGLRGRQRAEACFDIRGMVASYERFYAEPRRPAAAALAT